MDIFIGNSSDYPEFLNTIAKWHYNQWHHILPNMSLKQYKEFLSSHYKKEGVPTLFVAICNGVIVGTAALEDYDMDTHKELSPWLASVYVENAYRGKGIGQSLICRVIKEARFAKVRRIFLFTTDHEDFYVHLGWETLFEEEYYGEHEYVMFKDI